MDFDLFNLNQKQSTYIFPRRESSPKLLNLLNWYACAVFIATQIAFINGRF